jgi:hypothetical protein
MQFSRRELYALGEPFGDSATHKVAGGRIIYGGGGGGKQPSNTTQTQELPAWAIPYAKDVLAKGAALTNINNNPYVKYGGERLAGFDPMQQQSFAGARGMQVAPQIGQATQYATQAGRYAPVGQQYTGANVGQYMNPFLENALAPQLRKAAEAGRMAQQEQAAKAVGMGAFGGTRGALQQSMVDQNTRQNLSDINAQGYSDAFNQAAGMFNTDQARRIQEAQFGNSAQQQAAGLLSQLGGQQFQQGMDINKLLNTYGAQQQAQKQRADDIAHQNFMDQQNYAYKQLSYMSDLIKNPAIGSRNQTQMYEAPTSPINQLAGLGLTAAGAAAAKGGLMGYAGGGDVNSSGNISEILSKLSDEQLQQAMQTHPEMAQEIQMEIARREDVRGAASMPPMEQGLGAAPAGPMPQMAGGGIVAFADEGLVQGRRTSLLEDYQEAHKDDEEKKKLREAARARMGTPITLFDNFYAPVGDTALGRGLSGIANFLDPTQRPKRTTRVDTEGTRYRTMPNDHQMAIDAYNSPNPATQLQGPPAPGPDNRSGSDSSRGLGFSRIPIPDLSYKAQSPEEIERQIGAISQRGMEKNKGYLDAEAADVKEEADALLKAKGGDQKRLLFNMAAAAFGSKANGLDLGGIMTAGLKTDADQREKNALAERALRNSRSNMRKFEQAMKAGEDTKAGQFYGLAQTEAWKAHQAKTDQIELALKQKGLDINAAQLKTQQAALDKPSPMVDLLTKLGGGNLQEGFKLYNANKGEATDMRVATELEKVKTNFAKSARGYALMNKPQEYAEAERQAQIDWLRSAKQNELADMLGFAGGAGKGNLGPLVQQGT